MSRLFFFGCLLAGALVASACGDTSITKFGDDANGSSNGGGSTSDNGGGAGGEQAGANSSSSSGGGAVASSSSSSSASSTGASSSSSSGGGTPPDCTPDPNGDACIECGKEFCCDEVTDCSNDSVCSCIYDCVLNGGDPFDCALQTCPGGATNPAAQAVLACVQGNCDVCGF